MACPSWDPRADVPSGASLDGIRSPKSHGDAGVVTEAFGGGSLGIWECWE